MPEENDLEKKESRRPWLKGSLAIYLIYPSIVITFGVILSFALPRILPKKPPPPEIEVTPIQYESQGEPLSKIIKHIEGETDYDVVATKEVEEINIYGSFQGDDWVHILKKVINTYDKQLKLDLDEKNKKITITLKPRSAKK